MMSGAAVGNKTTGDRALQQQIQTVWKTLQDTRSNLFICDTLIRQIVKPAPAIGATVSRQMPETSVQTDVWPVTSVGTQCVCGTVENECCQTAPELCTRGVQAKEQRPIHHSRAVRDWFQGQERMKLLPFVPRSPNINQIENMWAEVTRMLLPPCGTNTARQSPMSPHQLSRRLGQGNEMKRTATSRPNSAGSSLKCKSTGETYPVDFELCPVYPLLTGNRNATRL